MRRLRCALEDLVRRRGRANVHVTHVRSHTNLTGNEIADGLAKLAANDAAIGDDRAMQLALDALHFFAPFQSSRFAESSRSFFGTFLPSFKQPMPCWQPPQPH